MYEAVFNKKNLKELPSFMTLSFLLEYGSTAPDFSFSNTSLVSLNLAVTQQNNDTRFYKYCKLCNNKKAAGLMAQMTEISRSTDEYSYTSL